MIYRYFLRSTNFTPPPRDGADVVRELTAKIEISDQTQWGIVSRMSDGNEFFVVDDSKVGGGVDGLWAFS